MGLLFNEELYVLDPEGVLGSVGTAFAVFAWTEEEKEEGDSGEIADGGVSWGGSLGGGVQGLDNVDREGPYFCWRKILLLIGQQLASQPKVELPHVAVSGVVGPHTCKYLTDQAEVLLEWFLLDKLPLRGQKASTATDGENLEEGDGVLNVFEVRGDF